jgi:5-methylcytosine-specific restriction endonuclease McrA
MIRFSEMKILSEQTKEKMRQSALVRTYVHKPVKSQKRLAYFASIKGENNPMKKIEIRKKLGQSLRNSQRFQAWHKNNRNENHYNWKGGITPERDAISIRKEYRDWRMSILNRDDYRCFDCGEKDKKMQLHHLYPWDLYPRLRMESANAITLCVGCHRNREAQLRKRMKFLFEVKIYDPF